jgi:hypothetical protein
MSVDHPNKKKELWKNADLRQGTYAVGKHGIEQAMPAP